VRDAEPATRRGVVVVLVLALLVLVSLLLGHRWLSNYADTLRSKSKPDADMPSSSGVAGVVSFADGSPAAAARVAISWTDSAGRPGSTPALCDGKGRFVQPGVPAHAKITRVQASVGPLAGDADSSTLAGGDATGVRVRIALPATFRLAGLVRKSADRAAVAGAKLTIGDASATSGAAGEFKLDAVPAAVLSAGNPILHVVADGMKSLDWPLAPDDPPASYGDLQILLEPSK